MRLRNGTSFPQATQRLLQTTFVPQFLLLLAVMMMPPLRAQTVDDFNPSPLGTVHCLVIQPDGMILIGGTFTNVGWSRSKGIARLTQDGALDPTFHPAVEGGFWVGTHYEMVNALALQPDGKVLVGGGFTSLNGERQNRLARLNSDGSTDATFGAGADDWVRCLALQPDGRILVGGNFTTLAGEQRYRLGRLHSDGSLDSAFQPEVGRIGVSAMALQADGKIVFGGTFTNLWEQPRNYLGRLHPDGKLDRSFEAETDDWVNTLAVQADGCILVGGDFTRLAGQPRSRIGRLRPDGTLDDGFNPGAAFEWSRANVFTIALQADGEILVGGAYSLLGGQTRRRVGRLHPDGTLDSVFDPGASGGDYPFVQGVWSLAVQPDGRILTGGSFTNLGGLPRNYLGRLINSDVASQSLTYNGGTITWVRGGASPEVWRTTFEYSPGDENWTSLGSGIRTDQGWQLTGARVPPGSRIRARGMVSGGGRSEWFTEALWEPLSLAVTQFSAGILQLNLTGPAGSRWRLQQSPDCLNWQAVEGIGLIELVNGRATVEAPTGNASAMFYRLASEP